MLWYPIVRNCEWGRWKEKNNGIGGGGGRLEVCMRKKIEVELLYWAGEVVGHLENHHRLKEKQYQFALEWKIAYQRGVTKRLYAMRPIRRKAKNKQTNNEKVNIELSSQEDRFLDNHYLLHKKFPHPKLITKEHKTTDNKWRFSNRVW